MPGASDQPRRFRRSDGVIPRKVAGELLLVPRHTTSVLDRNRRAALYVLNGSAEDLWAMLEQPSTSAELARKLTEAFDTDPDTAQADVERFLRDLVAIGAVTQE